MFKRKIYLSAMCATFATLTIVPSVFADANGFTLGVDYGRTEAKKYCDHITNCSNTDNGPKFEVGYDFTQNFGVELGYTSFGTIFDSNNNSLSATQKSNAITLSLLGIVPISTMFGVYGRVGYAHYDTNNSGVIEGVPLRDEKGNSSYWGAGAKLNISEPLAIRVEYQRYSDLSDLPGHKDDVQGLFAGIVYRFL